MHSSRMHIAHSSSLHGGPPHHPQSRHPNQIPLNFPLGCGPGPDPPQLPPWLWAWTRSPSTFPLGVGLETLHPSLWPDPPKLLLGCGPGNLQGMLRQHPPPMETCCKACWDTTCNACWDSTPPLWTDTPVKTTFANYVAMASDWLNRARLMCVCDQCTHIGQ